MLFTPVGRFRRREGREGPTRCASRRFEKVGARAWDSQVTDPNRRVPVFDQDPLSRPFGWCLGRTRRYGDYSTPSCVVYQRYRSVDYILFLTADVDVTPNLNEVQDYRYVNKEELQLMFDDSSEHSEWSDAVCDAVDRGSVFRQQLYPVVQAHRPRLFVRVVGWTYRSKGCGRQGSREELEWNCGWKQGREHGVELHRSIS